MENTQVKSSKIGQAINKIGEAHIPLKWIIAFITVLLIVLYFCNASVLFEDMIRLLIPFLIGTSVKVALNLNKILV